MDTLVREKVQVSWGVEMFQKFVLFIFKTDTLSSSTADIVKEELSNLLLEDENSERWAERLNQSIVRVNELMKQNVPVEKYAPFPQFSFIVPGHERSAVLDQIDMLQRTLTEASESKILDWIKERDHFTAVLKLFSQVESGKIPYEKAMTQIDIEIEKINDSLPEQYKLPRIDLSAYQ